jgi:hypothetical protein
MRTIITSLVVAAATGIAAQQAAAVVTFAFDDNPDSAGQFTYAGPNALGEMGSLSYDSDVLVDLAVDATGEGGSEFEYANARFTFSADVGAISDGPVADTWFAPLSGGLLEFRTGGGALLFSGAFGTEQTPAYLVIIVNTGSINISLEVGGLVYTPGNTLLGDLSDDIGTEVIGFTPPFDGVWTLSNLPALTTSMPPGGGVGDVFLDDFRANSSFSGTAGVTFIPGPGAGILAGLGLTLIGLRRRR